MKLVAVRSSATVEDSASASWAGELESFLNISSDQLLESIKKCWASLFSPRAISYRFEKGFQDKKVSVAVIVQKMIESEVSGIAFSLNPVTNDGNQIVIEAGWGLGEAIVSGSITPDTYVVNKESLQIVERYPSEQFKMLQLDGTKGNRWFEVPLNKIAKQKLSDIQIADLGRIVLKVEEHYQSPQDIEWDFSKSKFYLLQSRPITTLR